MKIQKMGAMVLLWVSCFVCSHAYADTLQPKSKKACPGKACSGKKENKKMEKIQGKVIDGKYYVIPGTVCVLTDGIYLRLDGKMIPVTFLGVDARGVYANESEVPVAKRWECDICHKYNPDDRSTCMRGCEKWDIDVNSLR